MLFHSESATYGLCYSIGISVFCFDVGMQSLLEKKPAI